MQDDFIPSTVNWASDSSEDEVPESESSDEVSLSSESTSPEPVKRTVKKQPAYKKKKNLYYLYCKGCCQSVGFGPTMVKRVNFCPLCANPYGSSKYNKSKNLTKRFPVKRVRKTSNRVQRQPSRSRPSKTKSKKVSNK
jgi:hypothetical protein